MRSDLRKFSVDMKVLYKHFAPFLIPLLDMVHSYSCKHDLTIDGIMEGSILKRAEPRGDVAERGSVPFLAIY